MLRRANVARRVAAQRLPIPGSTLIALVVFGLVATMVAGLAAFAGTSPGAPSPQRQPATPGTVQPPLPTATPAPPSDVPLVDASSVRRASQALGVRVDPTPTWRPLGTNLAAYAQATGQVRLQFESGAAYVSLINVAHRRGTVSDERQLVALLALADVARSAEQEIRALTPPPVAAIYHQRLLRVLRSYGVAAHQYWQATVRPSADTLYVGSRSRQLSGVLDAAFRYNTLPTSPADGDALGEP